MTKTIMIISLLISVNLFAVNTQDLLKAHKEALKVYKGKDRDISKSIDILRKADIESILNKQPKNMKQSKYIHLLNDYAFFLSESGKIDEALPVLHKVLQLSPNRAVVYLNLGDIYKDLFDKTSENKYLHKTMFYYGNYIKKVKKSIVPKRVSEFLSRKQTYSPALTEIIQKIKSEKYRLSRVFDAYNHPEYTQCKQMAADLLSFRGFTMVEPEVVTKDYDSKEMKTSLGKCWEYDLNLNAKRFPKSQYKLDVIDDNLYLFGKTSGEISFQKDGLNYKSYKDQFKKQIAKTRWNNKVYKVEFDQNMGNGDDIVFSGEGYFKPDYDVSKRRSPTVHNDLFTYVNAIQCEKNKNDKNYHYFLPERYTKTSVPNMFRDKYSGKPTKGRESGVVTYNGKYYIYNYYKYFVEKKVYFYFNSCRRENNNICSILQACKFEFKKEEEK